jgi:hypothetical protein
LLRRTKGGKKRRFFAKIFHPYGPPRIAKFRRISDNFVEGTLQQARAVRTRVFKEAPVRAPSRYSLWVLWSAAGALLLAQVSCGGSFTFNSNTGTGGSAQQGNASVSLSDPPSCKVPAGNYRNVFITVASVQAHTSGTASETAAGWVELAPALASNPVQIDLLANPAGGGCTLAQLGSNVSLPAGDYQQIRLILLANNAASGPSPNACASVQGFNCAILQNNSVHRLELSSQANTGLKIPPGQIVGGPIRVNAGQHVDINIDFNVCSSIVIQGNGQFRLKPALTAGQVSTVTTAISGQVVDSTSQNPIANGMVFVAVEQPDSNGVDRVVMEAAADANGNFNFCPLPTGTYDVVAVAVDASGNAFAASIVIGIPAGTALSKIPLTPLAAGAAAPATIEGVVTAANGPTGASVDAAMSALQSVTLPSGSRLVTIPPLPSSVANVTTIASPAGTTCPMGTFCEKYTLKVPPGNPAVGAFSAGVVTMTPPLPGNVNYTVDARAFAPNSTGTAICNPSRVFTDKDAADANLVVTAATTTTAKRLDFTACQ